MRVLVLHDWLIWIITLMWGYTGFLPNVANERYDLIADPVILLL